MKNQEVRPKYAHLEYDVRRDLDISWAEFVLCDMIYVLSRNRWCNKKLKAISEDMGITKHGVIKMLKRLESKGLVEKSDKGYRTQQRYHVTKLHIYDPNIKKGELSSNLGKQSYTKDVTKLHDNREQNNSKNNKEDFDKNKRGNGYNFYQEQKLKLFGR